MTFLSERDGPIERVLKKNLSDLLATHTTVRKVYLARAHYDGSAAPTVCLALKVWGGVAPKLVREIGAIFARQFARDAHLDILALNAKQETQIDSVCKPFYEKG